MKLLSRNHKSLPPGSGPAVGPWLPAAAVLMLVLLAACSPLRWRTPRDPLLVTGHGIISEPGSADEGTSGKESLESQGYRSPSRPVSGWTRFRKSLFGGSEPDIPDWASETIGVRAAAPVSSEATSHVEAFFVARRQACDNALRLLAERVAALPIPSGGTIQSLLETDGDLRDRLEETIRTRTVIQAERQERENLYGIVARLELTPVAAYVMSGAEKRSQLSSIERRGASESRTLGRGVKIPGDPSRFAAFEKAERDAREKMLERVRKENYTANLTFGNLMAVEPGAAAEVIRAVQRARIVRTHYPAPDACELVLSLDLERLRKILR